MLERSGSSRLRLKKISCDPSDRVGFCAGRGAGAPREALRQRSRAGRLLSICTSPPYVPSDLPPSAPAVHLRPSIAPVQRFIATVQRPSANGAGPLQRCNSPLHVGNGPLPRDNEPAPTAPVHCSVATVRCPLAIGRCPGTMSQRQWRVPLQGGNGTLRTGNGPLSRDNEPAPTAPVHCSVAMVRCPVAAGQRHWRQAVAAMQWRVARWQQPIATGPRSGAQRNKSSLRYGDLGSISRTRHHGQRRVAGEPRVRVGQAAADEHAARRGREPQVLAGGAEAGRDGEALEEKPVSILRHRHPTRPGAGPGLPRRPAPWPGPRPWPWGPGAGGDPRAPAGCPPRG